MKTYVTFGFDHKHTINGFTFDKDSVAVVEGEDASDARDNAFKAFGPKFCMEYSEDYFEPKSMKYFPRGIFDLQGNQVPTPDELPKWKRYQFSTKLVGECNPLISNPQFPWWVSGTGSDSDCDFTVIVAYLPHNDPIYRYWNDAFDIAFTREDEINFSDRYPKPDDFIES